MRRLFGKPFVQFLVLGGLSFSLFSLLAEDEQREGESIIVDEAFVRSIREAWKAKRLREPSAVQLEREVQNRVRTELFYREGLARGLDLDDRIIKRRVAQKLEFLIAGPEMDPSESELRAYYETNKQSYRQEGTVSFRHLYFSKDRKSESDGGKHAEAAEGAARRVFSAIMQDGSFEDWSQKEGDSSGLPRSLQKATRSRVEGNFGQAFSAAIFSGQEGVLPPVESEFGWHVVRLTESVPTSQRPYDEVRTSLRQALLAEQLEQAKDEFEEELRKKYPVEMTPGVLPEAKGGL